MKGIWFYFSFLIPKTDHQSMIYANLSKDTKKIFKVVSLLEVALEQNMFLEFRSLCVTLADRIFEIVASYIPDTLPEAARSNRVELFSDPEMQKIYKSIAFDSQKFEDTTLSSEFGYEYLGEIKKFLKLFSRYVKSNISRNTCCTARFCFQLQKFYFFGIFAVLMLGVSATVIYAAHELTVAYIKPMISNLVTFHKQKYIDIDLLLNNDKQKSPIDTISGFSPLEFDDKTGRPYRWAMGPRVTLRFFSSVQEDAIFTYSFSNVIESEDIKIFVNGKLCKYYRNIKQDRWLIGNTHGSIKFPREVGLNTIQIDISKWNGNGTTISLDDDRPLGVPFTKFRVYSEEIK